MNNIKVDVKKDGVDVAINDKALIRRYEKACGLDAEKITAHIEAFLSRN